jgi:hypothetical protein
MSDDEDLLFTADVARMAGVARRSITMYSRASRRKAAAGVPLDAADLPIPDPADAVPSPVPGARRRLAPRWRRDVVEGWLAARRRGGGRRRPGAEPDREAG